MTTIFRKGKFLGVAMACLTAASLFGCKDFLVQSSTPQGTLDANTLSNKAGVEGNLVAAYRSLDWNNAVGGAWGSAASNWIWGSVASDDAYKGSEATDQPAIDPVEFYDWGASGPQGELNDKWRASYEGVVRSNATIRLLKSVVESKPNEIGPADAKSIEGEATFLRAHYHFEAWRMWANIPYFREADLDFRKPALTKVEAVAEILKDLDAAIALLPATPRNNQKGRVTLWTAKAYKGRVQVYAGQFAAALTTLREVKASNIYALETSYDKVWTAFPEYSNGKETILAYQASTNDGSPDGNNANYGERLAKPHAGSPFACCGFHQPSFNLVNYFQVDATTGLPLAITSPATWNASYGDYAASCPQANMPYPCVVTTNTTLDPRLDWTVGRDGVPYKDWGKHNPTWIRQEAYGGPFSGKKNADEKAAGAQSSVGWTGTQLNNMNIHIFRYADMLLLLAEAEIEAGTLANALQIVNDIRTRAAATAQGPGLDRATMAVPITDASITWAKYKVGLYPSFPSQAYAREAVRAERRLELAMEGQRFFDLRRYGTLEATLNAYSAAEKTRLNKLVATQTVSAKHYLFPIPQTQIDLSKAAGGAGLTQNTGW